MNSNHLLVSLFVLTNDGGYSSLLIKARHWLYRVWSSNGAASVSALNNQGFVDIIKSRHLQVGIMSCGMHCSTAALLQSSSSRRAILAPAILVVLSMLLVSSSVMGAFVERTLPLTIVRHTVQSSQAWYVFLQL